MLSGDFLLVLRSVIQLFDLVSSHVYEMKSRRYRIAFILFIALGIVLYPGTPPTSFSRAVRGDRIYFIQGFSSLLRYRLHSKINFI